MRLQEKLKGKKYIIIDEMSMLGKNTFSWIDKRQATVCYDQPFGAMFIILISDFAQLPPVGDRLLFMNPSLTNHESNDHGYLLYKQFQMVVKLNQILRQDLQYISENCFQVSVMERYHMTCGKHLYHHPNLKSIKLLRFSECKTFIS